MIYDITKHEKFNDSKSKLLCQLIGGSHLYHLNTPESDVDYRGIFCTTNPIYNVGFNVLESIVTDGEVDSTHYELAHYMKLLKRSNTQVYEILFAPSESLTFVDPLFSFVRSTPYEFMDSHKLKASLKGYIHSEMRLATGARSGQLGGKRKEAVTKYGFSPKNFVQILRLCQVGIHLYTTGEYIVSAKQFGDPYYNFLMEIKTQPENFTCDQLTNIVNIETNRLIEAMDNSKIDYKFNTELAADIIESTRSELLKR